MESIVQVSELDWMIMRPLGLANIDPPTTYAIAEDHVSGRQTARRDLAAAINDQLGRTDYHEKVVAVAPTNKGRAYLRPSGEKPSSRDFGSATEQAEQAGSVPRKPVGITQNPGKH